MFFVAERAIHQGSLEAFGVPRLPPDLRVAQADGDLREAACQPRGMAMLAS